MSFFLGGGGKKVKPEYTGIQMQTASSVLALAIVWGCNRDAHNLIWYNDFTPHKQKQKVGKGGGSVDSYTYSASCILALCEGVTYGIGKYWKDQSTQDFSASGFSFFNGSTPQAPWGYVTSKHPTEARSYPGVSYVGAANYDLGSSASLPNHSFEVKALRFQTSKDGSNDADPAYIIDDFLLSPAFGVGMPTDNVGLDTLYSTGHATTTGDATFQTYCAAQGFGLSPVLSDPTSASDTFDKWMKMLNTAVVWTGYKLNFIPYDIADIDGNGYKYRPNRTPAYTLTDDDYVSNKEDPVQVSRVDPADASNSMKLTFSNAANEYNDAPVEWKDQGLIDQFGLRQASTFETKDITRIDMATKVVAIMGQREAYIRNTYIVNLGPAHCLIEPMDLLILIDKKIGSVLVRVTNVEEDDDGDFKVTSEEVTLSVSSSQGFTPPTITPSGNNQLADPGPVNTPMIFDVPADLSNGIPQVWVAVSGGNGTTYNKYWGGCQVYISRDNTTYTNIGVVDIPARMGKTMDALPAYGSANPDTVNTVGVDLRMSNGELLSVSPDDAEANATLCLLGGEFVSYQDADLTATNEYDLSTIYRGLYRTAPGSHLSGVPFARLDEAIFKYQLPPEYIGVPLWFKFVSFNIWGQALEDVADVAYYTYTPSGLGFLIGDPASCSLAFNARTQADGTNIIEGTVTVGASPGPYLDHYDVQIAVDPYTTWQDIAKVSALSSKSTFQPALPSTNYKARARAVSSAVGGTPSNWVTTGVVGSGALDTVAPSAPTGLSTSGGLFSNKLTWTAGSGGGAVNHYNIYAIHGSSGSFGSAVLVGTSLSPFFTHSGLSTSDTWRYWVTAQNFAGESTELGPANSTTSSSAGGGAFTSLTDVPSSYSGSALKWLRVNSTPNGLEFFTPTFKMLSDVPSSYSGQTGKSLRVNSGETGLEFYTPITSFSVKEDGTPVVATAVSLNFTGSGVVVTDGGSGQANVEINSPTSRIYAPLVNGDLPGPGIMANSDGQCIMVEVG